MSRSSGILLLVLILIMVGCDRNANSFRSLGLVATATNDPSAAEPIKVMVVGDVDSPTLQEFLDGKFLPGGAGFVLDVTDVPYVAYAADFIDMDGDYIVWSDNRNGNPDIFGYQISTRKEFVISTAAGPQRFPRVSGDYVVWEDYRNGNADIFAYQLSTARSFTITTAVHNQRYPQLDGDYVVWQDERGSDADIYAYQFSSGSEFIVSAATPSDEWVPQISGDVIIWQRYTNGFSDIYGYRISTATVFPVSVASGSQYQPVLSQNYVVWIDNRNGDDDIYAYNLGSGAEFPVTNAAGQQWRPRISGNYVVWQDYRNGNYDIYARNLAGGAEILVSNAANEQINPEISGDTIVWQDFRHGNYEIYAYTISTATATRVTNHAMSQTLPVVSGNTLAWLDGRRGLVDVFYRDGLNGADAVASDTWVTPAGAVKDIADYGLVILGSDVFSNEVMLQIFDAAIAAEVDVLGLGGTGVSLAAALAEAGRYGISVTPASGCAPMEITPLVEETDFNPLFLDIELDDVLLLEKEEAETMDELAITIDASDPASPDIWDVWATFGGNMCNAAAPALVIFRDTGGSRVILDGSASVADAYQYWNTTRWTLLSNEATLLAP